MIGLWVQVQWQGVAEWVGFKYVWYGYAVSFSETTLSAILIESKK